jgi:hypothetical protein
MEIADTAAAEDRLVEHRSTRHLLDVLTEVADGQLPRHRHVAFVRNLFAGDHPEQRRLSRAIGSDEADLLAGIQLEGGVDEQHLLAVLLADFGERNHAAGSSLTRGSLQCDPLRPVT